MKAPNYYQFQERLANSVPLDVVEWRDPVVDDSYVVDEKELTEDEWQQFKKIIAGLA